MSALKLGPLLDEKPVRVTVELPAAVHRDLAAYADALARETGQAVEPAKLIVPMVTRFMAADRGFKRTPERRKADISSTPPPPRGNNTAAVALATCMLDVADCVIKRLRTGVGFTCRHHRPPFAAGWTYVVVRSCSIATSRACSGSKRDG